MTSDRHILYHVTSVERSYKIVETGGVDPSRATGKRAAAWLVTKTQVPWAIAHVMNRHRIELHETCVLKCIVHPRWRIRTNRQGVWCCEHICPVDDWWPAGDWLSAAETKIYIPSGYAKRAYRYGRRSL